MMTTENDIIFDHLYEEFKDHMDETINQELFAYMDEYGIKLDLAKKLLETYVNEIKKTYENKNKGGSVE